MKKGICFLLMLILIVGALFTPIFADGTPAFRVSDASAAPGEEVTLTVSTENNPGIVGFMLKPEYDENVLEWVGVTEGNIGGTSEYVVGRPLGWMNSKPYSGNDVLFSLTFKVREGVGAGITAVTLSYDPDDVFDDDFENVDFAVIPGTVTITVPNAHTMEAHDAVQPTCSKNGNTAYYYCTDCGKYFSDADGNNEIEEGSWVINALGHTLVPTAAVEPTISSDGNTAYWTCSVCGKYFSDGNGEDEIEENSWIIPKLENWVKIEGNSLTLTGIIGLNFYVSSPSDNFTAVAEYDNSTVELTGTPDNGRIKYSVEMASAEDHKVVTLRFYDNTGSQMMLYDSEGTRFENDQFSYCMNDYFLAAEQTDNEPLKVLTSALKNYCEHARAYFGVDDTIASEVSEVNVTAAEVSGYAYSVNGLPEGISVVGTNLALESDTTLRIFFQLESGKSIGDYTFTLDNKEVVPVAYSRYYAIAIPNIPAPKLGVAHKITVSDGNSIGAITNLSALSYVHTALVSDRASASLKNAMKALYVYNQAAIAYFPNN